MTKHHYFSLPKYLLGCTRFLPVSRVQSISAGSVPEERLVNEPIPSRVVSFRVQKKLQPYLD